VVPEKDVAAFLGKRYFKPRYLFKVRKSWLLFLPLPFFLFITSKLFNHTVLQLYLENFDFNSQNLEHAFR
jgi:hypothetical protein